MREAGPTDADALVQLINAAYRVEDFFKIGDRIDATEVHEKLQQGRFLLLEDDRGLVGCVHIQVAGTVGHIALLSIDPSRQKQGLGAQLIAIAETACWDQGCREMEIEVVNLRTELPPYYRKFGYAEVGKRSFPDSERTSQPCHFIVMRKPLG